MAKPSLQLIDVLRKTANKIAEEKESYNWKAIGACNCGNLVQVITNYTAKEISTYGIQKHGDWQSISMLYEKDSRLVIDKIITQLLGMGIDIEDFYYLENLNDPLVLFQIGNGTVLERDIAENATFYLNAWADMLEKDLLKEISLEEIKKECVII